jgi:hypothetical protein
MVNSTAETRRHAAAVKIGFVYDLEYAAKPWFGFAACEESSDIHEREFPERDQSLLQFFVQNLSICQFATGGSWPSHLASCTSMYRGY